MHDDTVAKRYGFVGGLVPGVDVMAYMMHLPVAKWGRAFLERGLIEARFVKPVYDGELADVTGEERNGVLAIQVESRGELCATGTASLPPAAPSFSLSDFVDVAAVGERKPVDATSYALGKWLGAVPRTWAADAAKEYLADIRETEDDLRPGRARPPRPVAAGDEQGAGRQCHHGSVDSCRHPDAAAVRGAHRR